MENQVQAQQNQVQNYEVNMTNARGLRAMMGLADTLAKATIIPETFQGKPANVLIALNMAQRLNADPLMIMQNMYIVYGNPSFSSKFLIACFNTCGRFSSIKYEFFGNPGTDGYGVRAYATELATGEKIFSPDVTIKMAKDEGWYSKKGSKWVTIPQLMLMYRSAAFLIRTVAPEISMGLQTSEELEDIGDQKREVKYAGRQAALEDEVKAITEKAPVVGETMYITPVPIKEEVPQAVAAKPAPSAEPAMPDWMK